MPNAPRRQESQCGVYPLLEWCVRDAFAMRGRASGFGLAKAELPEPGDDFGRPLPCRCCRALGCCSFLTHELGAEGAFRRVLIVRAAAQPDVRGRRLAASRDLLGVIELEPRARVAAFAGSADKRALPAVAFPHGAFHAGGNVARAPGLAPNAVGSCRRGELPPSKRDDEQVECRVNHPRDVACIDLVAQEGFGLSQQVVRFLPNREVNRETLWCDGR